MLDKNAPILVIDSFKTMRTITCGMLRGLGFTNLTEAEDGDDAKRLFAQRPFELVVLAHKELHGGQPFAKVMRDDPALSGTKLLLVTAEKQHADILATLPGSNDSIEKPFRPDGLKDKIARLTGG